MKQIPSRALLHAGFCAWLIQAGSRQAASRALLANYFMLVTSLALSSTLKMEVTYSCKTLVNYRWTTEHYIQEDRTFWVSIKCSST
jgi:hypothetical protein